MILTTSQLKPLLKFLSCTKAETVVLDPAKGTLTVAETNLIVRVTSLDLIDENEPEPYAFPHAKFNSMVSKARTTISLSQDENTIKAVSGSLSVFFPKNVIPSWNPQVEYTYAKVSTDALKELVQYACAVTNAKESMAYTGVLQLKADQDLFQDDSETPQSSTLRIAATDGYRVAKLDIPCITGPFQLLLPATLIAPISAFSEDVTEIAETDNLIGLRCGNLEAIASRFSVKFPDVVAVFPRTSTLKATIKQSDLAVVIGNIQPFLDIVSPVVVCSFQQNLVISTGSAQDELAYETPEKFNVFGASFRTDFKFLADFVSKVTGDIFLETSQGCERVLLTSTDRKYLFVTKKK